MDINNFIDIEGAKERFMENEALYKKFLLELPERSLYTELAAEIDKGNIEEAFQTAHRMKGIIENISLNQLGRKISEVVEILRDGKLPDQNILGELEDIYQQTMEQIHYIGENNITLFQ